MESLAVVPCASPRAPSSASGASPCVPVTHRDLRNSVFQGRSHLGRSPPRFFFFSVGVSERTGEPRPQPDAPPQRRVRRHGNDGRLDGDDRVGVWCGCVDVPHMVALVFPFERTPEKKERTPKPDGGRAHPYLSPYVATKIKKKTANPN